MNSRKSIDTFVYSNVVFLNLIGSVFHVYGDSEFEILLPSNDSRNYRVLTVIKYDGIYDVKFTSGEIHNFTTDESLLDALFEMSEGTYQHNEKFLEHKQYYWREEMHRQIVALQLVA
jgi:hypothetical protein